MSKSEKSAYFCHFFANNFFWCIFKKFCQRIQNQREILRFLIPILIILLLIVNFKCKCARNGSKNEKPFFINVS
jgi:hypothetical protein